MSIAELLPTELRMEDLPERAWPREEIIDGSLHVTPLARAGHQYIVGRMCAAFLAVVPPDLVVLPGVNILRRGETDRLLIPDVAVIQKAALADNPVAVRPEDVYLAAEVISPSSSSAREPERSVRTRTSSSPTGIGRGRSRVIRVFRRPGRGSCRSMARPSRAEGGLPCWVFGLHGPAVAGVLA